VSVSVLKNIGYRFGFSVNRPSSSFYRSKDPTNSIKVLKEQKVNWETNEHAVAIVQSGVDECDHQCLECGGWNRM